MKTVAAILIGGVIVALYGCSSGTPGGPGTAQPESEQPMMGQTDDTFTLDVPMMATKLEQGERKTVAIGIKRGTNFSQDVSLRFGELPPGIHIQPNGAVISRSNEEVELTVHAAEDAAVGDFTVQISGDAKSGDDATAELSLTISKREMESSASIETDEAKADRAEHIARMQAELDVLKAKYEDLKQSASEAIGDTKEALDERVAAAKVKLDEAEENLREAKDADENGWEKVKAGFRGAADDLKSMFD